MYHMFKAKNIYIIDLLALIAFIVCAFGGYVIYFYLAGRFGFRGSELFGLSRRGWASVHQLAGHAFALLVITHFLMHWSWFAGMTKRYLSPAKKRSGASERGSPSAPSAMEGRSGEENIKGA